MRVISLFMPFLFLAFSSLAQKHQTSITTSNAQHNISNAQHSIRNAQHSIRNKVLQIDKVNPGEKQSFLLSVSDGKDSTDIPVTVFKGSKPGPVLGIIAGVHGYEYPPIIAVQQLSKTLRPQDMSGTIILVHIANVPGFLQRRIQFNPQDGKNLNRVFPGSATGSITERMAWTLGHEVMAKCDYLIDVHAGDAENDLMPYAGYYNYFDTPELSEKGRQLAVSMGFNTVVQFGNEQTLSEAAIYCSREGIKRNIPSVDIECGRYGQAEPQFIAQIGTALNNAIAGLGISGKKQQQENKPVYIAKRTTLSSEHTGFFYTDIKAGQKVKKGTRLGHITDLFGNHLSDVMSPVDAVVLYMTSTPPISQGESLFSLGHL